MARWPLLLPLLLVACSAAEPPPPATPPPAQERPRPPPPDPVERGDVVRCGVDDGPLPVVRSNAQDRALLGLPAAGQAPLGDMMPEPAVAPVFPQPALPQPPRPMALVTLGTPMHNGKAVTAQATEGLAGAASPSTCDALVEKSDEGAHLLHVDLMGSGAPASVRAGEPRVSRYVRCVMERACQLRAQGLTAGMLDLPFTLKVEPPPPPPPPPPPGIESRIRVESLPQSDPEMNGVLDGVVFQTVASCAQNEPAPSGEIKLMIALREPLRSDADEDERDENMMANRTRKMMPSKLLQVATVTSIGKTPRELTGLVACVKRGLVGQQVRVFRFTSRGKAMIKVTL